MVLCSLKDERLASFAKIEAFRSKLPMKHGCIAVSGGKIIARGYNTYRTYSKDGLIHNCCSCHAEIDVLRKCLKQHKKKINFYIVRISENGEYKNSAPCSMCVKILKQHHIKMIIYSTDDGLLKKCKLIHYVSNHISGGQKAIINKRVISRNIGNCIIYKDYS
jgi:deoxycytidylate deaminase